MSVILHDRHLGPWMKVDESWPRHQEAGDESEPWNITLLASSRPVPRESPGSQNQEGGGGAFFAMPEYRLGYWNIRGLGQPLRIVCEVGGLNYTEDRYELKRNEDGTLDGSQWERKKAELAESGELDFPNLPYLFGPNGVKLSEFTAILSYLATKAGLAGAKPEEKATMDMLVSVSQEVRGRYVRAVYGDFEAEREDLVRVVEAKCQQVSRFYSRQAEGPYLLGQSITFADIVWMDLIDQLLELCPSVFDQFPNLKKLHSAVKLHPKIQSYMSSDHFIDRPFNNLHAKWPPSPL